MTNFCKRQPKTNKDEAKIGTEFFGVKLTNSLCQNVRILNQRNYKCSLHLDLWSVYDLSTTEIKNHQKIFISDGLQCANNARGEIKFFTKYLTDGSFPFKEGSLPIKREYVDVMGDEYSLYHFRLNNYGVLEFDNQVLQKMTLSLKRLCLTAMFSMDAQSLHLNFPQRL